MRNKIIFIAALIGASLFPNLVIIPADIGTNAITLGNICQLYVFFAALYFIYKRKHIPVYGKIWGLISLFFGVLFATLLAGYAKEKWKQKDYSSAFLALLLPLLWFLDKSGKSKKEIQR